MKCDVPRHQFCVMRRQPSNRLPLVQGKACSQANELITGYKKTEA